MKTIGENSRNDIVGSFYVCTKTSNTHVGPQRVTCDEQSTVPAGLGASSLQPHEADLQLLLVGLGPREHSAVARFLHHDGVERPNVDLQPRRQSSDDGPGAAEHPTAPQP